MLFYLQIGLFTVFTIVYSYDNQIYVSKDLHDFEMIFVIIYEKPNVLSGVRVCQISMIKEKSHTQRRRTVAAIAARGPAHPNFRWYRWYRWSIGTIDGRCHYKRLSILEIHI